MRYTTAPLLRPALARLSGAWPLLQLSYFVTRLRVYSGKPCYNQETIQSQVRASTHAKIKCQKKDPQQLLPGSTSMDKSHLKHLMCTQVQKDFIYSQVVNCIKWCMMLPYIHFKKKKKKKSCISEKWVTWDIDSDRTSLKCHLSK